MSSDDRARLVAALSERGSGSFLKGWRRELDPDGSLDVSFLEFCTAAKNLNVAVDAVLLFGNNPNELTLEQLAPREGALVNRFRKWMAENFGGPASMFCSIEAEDSKDGKMLYPEFANGCRDHGFEADDSELHEVFDLLDVTNTGSITLEEVMFLETDEKTREGAILKAKWRSKREHEDILANIFRVDPNKGGVHKGGHRLAPRAWHAVWFERLPALELERRKAYHFKVEERIHTAEEKFKQHLKINYGNFVRAWRRGLDPQTDFEVSQADLGRYCRRVNLDIDLKYLWKALDRDQEGIIHLEEFGHRHASAVAQLRYWAREKFGTCVNMWKELQNQSSPSSQWKSDATMPFGPFMSALRSLGWPGADNPLIGGVVCPALDYYGCGLISRYDLEWLDLWEAPPWLCVGSDPQAWIELRQMMVECFGRPLRAWRSMDSDDSNAVAWKEFHEECVRIGFKGNIAGAWRCLDEDASGTITLQEFDIESAELLSSFKTWLEKHFGSVEFAFKSIDTDGSGALTFAELNRACKRLKWDGDVRDLFDCLDVCPTAGTRTLMYKELSFLDSWLPKDLSKDGENAPEQAKPPSTAPAGTIAPAKSMSSSAGFVDRSFKNQLAQLSSSAGFGMRRSESCPDVDGSKLSLPTVSRSRKNLQPRSSVKVPRDKLLASMREENEKIRSEVDKVAYEKKLLIKSNKKLQSILKAGGAASFPM